ncbi:DUF4340 domain-containing protein [Desulfoluna butyratoxydans]|uniref:DUF4340 domain-containing protein n=1 Tax=Desulfoluna butyratoxydans TaxID=231438 RepID=A0A4U8YLS4_9BACT|nr:DUF4340 domain-containing protein [Desulfoluna butyratoxydans]VFQ44916.1 domain of unknown function duf4340 [Desulfoluna butyratoxydans]
MKKETIILLALIVALSAYLFLRDTDGTSYELPVLDTVSAGDVDRMEIKTQAETLLFEKEGDEWTVDLEGFPAKQEQVTKLVETAGEMTLTAMVSEAESYNRYDLDPGTAKNVRLYKGETVLRDVTVGKAAPSMGHTFVTIEGDKKVYHAKGNFASQFTTDSNRFIDKTVFNLVASEVNALAVTMGETDLALTRATEPGEEGAAPKTIWKDQNGNTLSAEKVDKLIASLCRLSCDTWLMEEKKDETPALSVVLTTDRPYTLKLFGDAPMHGTATDQRLGFTLSEAKGADILGAVQALEETPQAELSQAHE